MTPARREAFRSFFVGPAAAQGNGANVRILLLVLFGGAGTVARYGLDGLIQQRTGSSFPVGILTVNLLGCLLMGAIGTYGLNHISVSADLRIGLTTGLMGGFTTFSTFSWDTVRMLDDGQWQKALLYVGASILGGLLVMMVGIRIGNVL
jgi:fluoride exporter